MEDNLLFNKPIRGLSESYLVNSVLIPGLRCKIPYVQTVDLETMKPVVYEPGINANYCVDVELEEFEANASLTTKQRSDMFSTWGIDADAMLRKSCEKEMFRNVGKQAVDKLFELGETHADYLAENKRIRFSFEKNAESILTAIVRAKEMIHSAVGGDMKTERFFVVMSDYLASTLTRGDAAAQIVYKDAQYPNGQLYCVAHMEDVSVYANTELNGADDRILVGRICKKEEPGLYMAYNEFSPDAAVVTTKDDIAKITLSLAYRLIEVGEFPWVNYMTIGSNISFV